MKNLKILSKEEVIKQGYDFNGSNICWSGEYGDQVFDCPIEEGGHSITGIVYELYKNGEIQYYCRYENGIKNGECISFYQNGELKGISMMNNGSKHGKTTYWYEDGRIKSETESKYGFDVICRRWDENGNLVKEQLTPTAFASKMIKKYEEM